MEARIQRGAQEERVIGQRLQFDHFFAEVEIGLERPDLFQQTVDQLLGAAHRQRRDVIDGFIRVKLRALAARMLEGIDEVGVNTQQPEFEYLKQPAGPGADNHSVGGNGPGKVHRGFNFNGCIHNSIARTVGVTPGYES